MLLLEWGFRSHSRQSVIPFLGHALVVVKEKFRGGAQDESCRISSLG